MGFSLIMSKLRQEVAEPLISYLNLLNGDKTPFYFHLEWKARVVVEIAERSSIEHCSIMEYYILMNSNLWYQWNEQIDFLALIVMNFGAVKLCT
jgi:hypothetical protein